MRDMMEDVWIPTPSSPMVFTRCDICDKDYLAPESQINNPTSAIIGRGIRGTSAIASLV